MLTVAQTILAQLGGARFRAMTGASSFSSGPNTLGFRLPPRSAKNGIKAVVVTLDPSDTYTVVFLKVSKLAVVKVREVSGLYADQLCEVFTETTGLYTSL